MTKITNERLAEMLAEVDIEQENAVADAEADQNPQLAVDAVGEFALSEMSSILTELQSLRAQGGVRVKAWETRPQGEEAMEPSEIDVHEGAWAIVVGTNGKPAGWIDTHALFAHQLYCDQILPLEASPAPVSEELVEENKRLREAIEYYEIGVCAVGVPHEAERKVLHDCVREARALAAKGGQ